MHTILDLSPETTIGRRVKMTMTVTTINYSDIDMAIFEECFNDTLPYLDRDPPNIIWEEGGLTPSSSAADKLQYCKDCYGDGDSAKIIFKLDIDGRIVNYGYGALETGAPNRFVHLMDLLRKDASGSRSWTYTAEYNTKIDAWYKSVSGGEVTSSLWVIPESTMEKAYDDCVTAGFLTYEVAENKTYHGRPYRKLIVTFK